MNSSQNTYNQLLKRRKVTCDFCDEIFKNRFENIIHTASHIIIPIIKQNYYQCEICLYYYDSQDDLCYHLETNHLKTFNNDKRNLQHTEKLIKTELKEAIRNRKNSTQHTATKHENESDCDSEHNNKQHSIRIKEELEDSVDDDRTGDDYEEFSKDKTEPIKSRLRFEEDDDLFHNNIFSDFITECKVKAFKEPRKQMLHSVNHNTRNGMNNVNNYNKCKDAYNDKEIDDYEFDNFVGKVGNVDEHSEIKPSVNSVQIVDTSEIEPEPIYHSVHYTDLKKPGIFKCKYCCKSFPNRFHLIQHEPEHINIKKPRPLLCTYCDRYIAGNYIRLRRHIRREHPGADVERKRHTHKCERCGLKFRKYMSHVKNYHPYDCHGCGKEFGKKQMTELNEHIHNCVIQNVSSKILKICELCYSFVKVKTNLKYTLMGTVNEPGVRYPCAMCGKKHFELKTIKRVIYGANLGVRNYHKRKPLSNEERLKKFQHRLKRINLLNKFYTVYFIFPDNLSVSLVDMWVTVSVLSVVVIFFFFLIYPS